MKPQTIVVLAAITLATVVLAVISANVSTVGNAVADRGKPLVSDAIKLAERATAFTIESDDGKTRVERKGDGFVDASGYPANAETVRKIAASLALLTIEERKTADPSRYEDLELAAPDAKNGAGTRVVIEGDGGTKLLSLIAGAREYTVGGTRGGQYVRVEGQPQSYLVRGSIDAPIVRSNWFDTKLAEIKDADLVQVTARDKDKVAFDIKRDGDKLVVADLPEGATADDAKLGRIKRLLAPLSFADVRATAKSAKPTGANLRVQNKAGLSLTLTQLTPLKPDDEQEEHWVRVAVESTSDSAAAAKELETKLNGYDFRLSSGEIEILKWTTKDLVKEAAS